MRLFILPYLHSKFIFLNRLKPNTEYFYTSIEQVIHVHEPDEKCSSSEVSSSMSSSDDHAFVDVNEDNHFGNLEKRTDNSYHARKIIKTKSYVKR